MDYIYVIDGVDFILYILDYGLNLFHLPAGNGGALPLGRWDLKPRLSNGKLSGRHSGFDLLDMAGNRQQHWCPEKLMNT